ncbi:MAG: patatin-like phospholipase family protein, partial [Planctomycetaceae bacterium]|nr:patatin-like phospholipase family protein [Planctomycetaceae bacterium]
MFKILSIDGGGFRGVYAAHILKRIEETYGVSWTTDFDMITGTSTGSIIAAGLVCGMSAKEIADKYKTIGKIVFKKKFSFRLWGIGDLLSLLYSPYNANILEKELNNVFGNKKLGDYKFPLLIPATDIANGSVYVFKSQYNEEFVRDKDILVADAVLASCSAPAFFDPQQVGNYLLADGGLWANNPILVAAAEAKRRFNQPLENLRILSLGTGESRLSYSMKPSRSGWGFLTRWKNKQLIEMILNLQMQSAKNILNLLLYNEKTDKDLQVLRLTETDMKESMDDPTLLQQLVTRAD